MSESRTTQKRSTVKPSEHTDDKPVEVGVDGAVESKNKKPAARSATAKTTTAKSATAKAAQTEVTAKPSSAKSTAKKTVTVKTPATKSAASSATKKTTATKPASKVASGAKKPTAKASATVKPSEKVDEQKSDTVEQQSVNGGAEQPVAVESVENTDTVVEQTESAAEQTVTQTPEQAAEASSDGKSAVAEAAATNGATAPDGVADGKDGAQAKGDAAAKGKRKMSVVGIVFTCIGVAIVAFLLFVAITLAVDKFVKKSPVPSFFGTSTLIVTTGSMSGTIEDGDMIVVKKSDEYKIGDIITFLPAGDTVPTTHRIIRINDGKFYTKGDANNAEDTRAIEQSDIVGKVAFTVPHVGLFFRWLKDDLGWIYLVAAVVVIVAGIVLLKQFPSNKKINKD